MQIFNHLKSDWFRYGFETLAVIAGILIAFALESWHESQQIKQEERTILVNLLGDLDDARIKSSALVSEEVQLRDYLISALGLGPEGESLPPEFYCDSVFFKVIWSLKSENQKSGCHETGTYNLRHQVQNSPGR